MCKELAGHIRLLARDAVCFALHRSQGQEFMLNLVAKNNACEPEKAGIFFLCRCDNLGINILFEFCVWICKKATFRKKVKSSTNSEKNKLISRSYP